MAWIEDPGLPGEKRARWCRYVADYLEGEVPNGLDDNGNGLIDEPGLCFTQENGLLVIRLTLEETTSSGEVLTQSVETIVTCRN